MKNIIKDIIKNKIHIGHFKKKRNFFMSEYVFNIKNNIDIINPIKFLYNLKIACKNLTICSAIGGKILYYGNKPNIKHLISLYAKKNNMPFINNKWSAGILTNISTIRLNLIKKKLIKSKIKSNIYKYLPKKEQNKLNRMYIKIKKRLNSIKNMDILPKYIIITDIKNSSIIIKEAKKMGVLIIGIVDTNCDPRNIDFPIPANDDLSKSVNYILNYLTNAIYSGLKNSKYYTI